MSGEFAEARETLTLSSQVASWYCRQLGALAPILMPVIPLQAHIGRQAGFQASVIDDKYWFAKLYELITYFELRDRGKFEHADFVLHFIPAFYKLYYDAMKNYLRGARGNVSDLWLTHFDGLKPAPDDGPGTLDGAKYSIKTGVTAHVQGDMTTALVTAYKTWTANPKPPFSALKKDFFENNRPTFDAAKAAFFIDLNDKGPFPFRPDVGQFVIASGEMVVGGGLAVEEVYKWRDDAWKRADAALAN